MWLSMWSPRGYRLGEDEGVGITLLAMTNDSRVLSGSPLATGFHKQSVLCCEAAFNTTLENKSSVTVVKTHPPA